MLWNHADAARFCGQSVPEGQKMKRFTVTLLAGVCLAGAAAAQNPPKNSPVMVGPAGQMLPTAPGGAGVEDEDFAVKAARAGLAEVADARLAMKKAERQDVKDMAKQMMDDHAKANQKLMEIAAKENVSLPKSPAAKAQRE